MTEPEIVFCDPVVGSAPLRLLVFADMLGASQSIAFVEGLSGARGRGEAAVTIVEESTLGADAASRASADAAELVEALFERADPTCVVLSRFGLAGATEAIFGQARRRGLPVVFHIDDDLMDLPVTAGVERYRSARHPRRAHVQHRAMSDADLVMAATPALADALARRLGHARIGWLENGTAGVPAPRRARHVGPVVVGYMGSASHDADLRMIAPALNALMERGADIRLELFGSIARQPAAHLLPGQVVRHDPVEGDYAAFRRHLAGLGWDVGLAPLADGPYNRCKTATKWAEYAEAGMAVLASDMPVYAPIIAADAAWPAGPDAWGPALERLLGSAELRAQLVRGADALLAGRYGWDRLEASVLSLLHRASGAARRRAAS